MTNPLDDLSPGGLVDQDILDAMEAKWLILGGDPECVQPASYDLRIGTVFYKGQKIDSQHLDADRPINIDPGEVVSITTEEDLKLPADVLGTAFPINDQSRKGLMVLNPGHVDPGFEGFLTVKALNLRKVPLSIQRGDKIFTVLFEKLPKEASQPYTDKRSRKERERAIGIQDVEVAPERLSDVITSSKSNPFVTKEMIKDQVMGHWLSWLPILLAVVAFLLAAVTLVSTLFVDRSSSLAGDASQHPPQTIRLVVDLPAADSVPTAEAAAGEDGHRAPRRGVTQVDVAPKDELAKE